MSLPPFGLVVCVTAFGATFAQAQLYNAGRWPRMGIRICRSFWANNIATPSLNVRTNSLQTIPC